MKIVPGDVGYVLEDVPHLSDFIPDLPVSFSVLSFFLSFFFNALLIALIWSEME